MMMILSVMQKVLEHSSVGGDVINNQMLHAFRKKIPYLQEAFKIASRKGGKWVQKLLTYWQVCLTCATANLVNRAGLGNRKTNVRLCGERL